jgi:hypothetical protein
MDQVAKSLERFSKHCPNLSLRFELKKAKVRAKRSATFGWGGNCFQLSMASAIYPKSYSVHVTFYMF